MPQASDAPDGETPPITVKKYANRRLYDTKRSCYITLDDLGAMVREGKNFRVIDNKSGDDITHSVLTQIIMEAENSGSTLLPVGFLRQLIGMYGNNLQSVVPQYLEASMTALQKNQQKFRSAVEDAIGANPLAEMAKRNFEIFSQAAGTLLPTRPGDKVRDEEIAGLKAEIAELKAAVAALKAGSARKG